MLDISAPLFFRWVMFFSLKQHCSINIFVVVLFTVLMILLLSSYSNSLYVPFTLDDSHSFVNEPNIHAFTFSGEGFEGLTKTQFGFYRFLPMLTFAVDLKWGGGSLFAFHATNIIIHILATIALSFMLSNLVKLSKCYGYLDTERWPIPSVLIVAFSAGIWALSPIQTNAVTYLVQRMTSMAALFYFASFGCYLKARVVYCCQCFFSRKVLLYCCLSFVFGMCSFFSKQNSATLPIVILLSEFLFVPNVSIGGFLKKYKFFIMLLMLFFILLVWYKVVPLFQGGYDHRHFTMTERLLTELRVVCSYIFVLLLPLPCFLNLEHNPVLSTSLFSPVSTLFSLFFLCLIIVVAWFVRKKNPLITFCIYWFFTNLLIESTVFPLELKFEHRLYLPSACFYFSVVLLLARVWQKPLSNLFSKEDVVKLFVSSSLVVFSFFSLLTYQRNIVWGDSVTLYQDCVTKSPNKPRAHSNLAKALAESGRYEESINECEKTLILGVKGNEEYWVASYNLVSCMVKLGEVDSAIEKSETLLKNGPAYTKKNTYPLFLDLLGNLYFDEEKYQQAFEHYMCGLKFSSVYKLPFLSMFENNIFYVLDTCEKKSFSLKMDDVGVKDFSPSRKMAEICFALGEIDLAEKYCENICYAGRYSSEYLECKNKIEEYNLLNSVQVQKGTIKSKYLHHPFESKFKFSLACTYILLKMKFPCDFCVSCFLNYANELKPESTDVLLLKSWHFYEKKLFQEALNEIDKAILLDDKYAQLWINRGLYCLGSNENRQALDAFLTALKLYPGYAKKHELGAMINLAKSKL